MRAVDLRDHRVEIPAPRGWRRREKIGVLGKERHDRDRAHDVVRPSRSTVSGVPARSPADVGCRCEEGHLQASPLRGPAGVDGDTRKWSAPPDHFDVVASTRRLAARDQMHGLEDVRLARAVRTDEGRHARGKVECSVLVTAEVLERDRGNAHARRAGA